MTPPRLFHNGRILIGDDFIDGAWLRCVDGRIEAIGRDARLPQGERIDLDGGWLVPGFIDVQVNGGGGVLFNNQPNARGVAAIGRAHRRFGTTGFLPTLISDDDAVMHRAIDAVREAIEAGVPGVLGIHLEGPYLADARKGTHDARCFRAPDAQDIQRATSLANGVTVLTVAPERVSPAAVEALVAAGATVCLGHSDATFAQAQAALAAGARGFTHLFNAMSPLTGREPGMVGAALDDAGSWCGLIVDGVHVHPGSLRVALAAKPRGKCFLVTDAMPMVGGDSDAFTLRGRTIRAVDGAVRNGDGVLAGSALDMATAVRNCVALLGLPLAEACRMASQYPAEFLRMGDTRGRLAIGMRADLVLLDADVRVRRTWIGGREVGEALAQTARP